MFCEVFSNNLNSDILGFLSVAVFFAIFVSHLILSLSLTNKHIDAMSALPLDNTNDMKDGK